MANSAGPTPPAARAASRSRSPSALTVDTTKLSPGEGDLIIGFFNGGALAAGASGPISFVLKAGSTVLISKTFTTAAEANAFFDDTSMNLGAIGSGPLSGTTLALTASLSVSVNAAGQGYFAQFIIGDPPASAHAASAIHFTHAMTALGAPLASAMVAEPDAPPFTPLLAMGRSVTAH